MIVGTWSVMELGGYRPYIPNGERFELHLAPETMPPVITQRFWYAYQMANEQAIEQCKKLRLTDSALTLEFIRVLNDAYQGFKARQLVEDSGYAARCQRRQYCYARDGEHFVESCIVGFDHEYWYCGDYRVECVNENKRSGWASFSKSPYYPVRGR